MERRTVICKWFAASVYNIYNNIIHNKTMQCNAYGKHQLYE